MKNTGMPLGPMDSAEMTKLASSASQEQSKSDKPKHHVNVSSLGADSAKIESISSEELNQLLGDQAGLYSALSKMYCGHSTELSSMDGIWARFSLRRNYFYGDIKLIDTKYSANDGLELITKLNKSRQKMTSHLSESSYSISMANPEAKDSISVFWDKDCNPVYASRMLDGKVAVTLGSEEAKLLLATSRKNSEPSLEDKASKEDAALGLAPI
ncbi:MAG: hypothetical protein ACXWQO_12315 [Bdellovibrionota bacterium]